LKCSLTRSSLFGSPLPHPVVEFDGEEEALQYLDQELAKCESWEGSDKSIRPLFSEEGGFQKAKKEGVGRDTILKFLGGNW